MDTTKKRRLNSKKNSLRQINNTLTQYKDDKQSQYVYIRSLLQNHHLSFVKLIGNTHQ